jgi:arginyl-tRNA synthetase
MNPLDDLRAAVEGAAADLGNGRAPSARPTLERPKRAGFGDYSTNAAMLLAPVLEQPPREIAERLGEALSARLGPELSRVDVAGPGFLNIFLSGDWYEAAAERMREAGEGWGGGGADPVEKINVEFVSANPTGPLTAAGGRHAAFGDGLARLLEFRGHEVAREYYVNDAGTQVLKLGESIRARARGEDAPEDGYQGEYVAELAARIPDAAERSPEDLGPAGVELLLEGIRASLHAFGADFDTWASEQRIRDSGEIEKALALLRERGYVYDFEGAVWLRTTEFGDDKDRVLRRSTGEYTYFAPDIAYHLDKHERGFERLIDVWGADHHGYVPRMKAAFAALGEEPEKLELLIMQFVNIVGRQMSKRRGEFVTLDDLLADIGVDAARWFMLQRSHDTTVELNLDLAKEQSSENPVYYVQYAHARASSILRERSAPDSVPSGFEVHPSEAELIKRLLAFPEEVAEAAARRAPHRISTYALELAQTFTAFYRDCPVLKADSDELRDWRLVLTDLSRRTIAQSLALLGVSAPETM